MQTTSQSAPDPAHEDENMEAPPSDQPESVLATEPVNTGQDAPASALPNNRLGQLREIESVEAADDLFQISNQLIYEARVRYWSARHSYHVIVGAGGGLSRQEYFLFCAAQERANFEFVWQESKRLHEQMHFPFGKCRLSVSCFIHH